MSEPVDWRPRVLAGVSSVAVLLLIKFWRSKHNKSEKRQTVDVQDTAANTSESDDAKLPVDTPPVTHAKRAADLLADSIRVELQKPEEHPIAALQTPSNHDDVGKQHRPARENDVIIDKELQARKNGRHPDLVNGTAADADVAAHGAASWPLQTGMADSRLDTWLELIVIEGPSKGKLYKVFGPQDVVVGRLATADCNVNDGEVSGRHARLAWCKQQHCWTVTDLGSLNGTILNGTVVSAQNRSRGKPQPLHDGDILTLGTTTQLRIQCWPAGPSASNHGDHGGTTSNGVSNGDVAGDVARIMVADDQGGACEVFSVPHAGVSACKIQVQGRDHRAEGKACEDVASLLVTSLPSSQTVMATVCDGHLGRLSAERAAAALLQQTAASMVQRGASVSDDVAMNDILQHVFVATDAAMDSRVVDGCTATAVVLQRAPLNGADGAGDCGVCVRAANVGDSAAVFVDLDRGEKVELTVDHRVNNPVERRRLQAAGAPIGDSATRVLGLNLSRSIGDLCLKEQNVGVTAEPSVSDAAWLPPSHNGVVVIASDGLWDVMNTAQVAAMACKAYHGETDEGGEAEFNAGFAESLAQRLLQHAMQRQARDDVLVFVLCLHRAV